MGTGRKATLLVVALTALPGLSAAQTTPSIVVTLKPLLEAGDIKTVAVTETFNGYSADAEKPIFIVPSRIALTRGQNYQEGDIIARDGSGLLPLKLTNVPSPAGQPLDLQIFTASRATSGPITLHYRATVTPAMSPRPPGPSYDLRGIQGGFGGAFFSFLLLPVKANGLAQVSINWDFSDAPPGSKGVTTSGGGNLSLTMSPAELNTVFFLGGKVSQYVPANSKFQAYWIGTPPFDARALSDWAGRSFNILQSFFRDTKARRFTLLMRPYANPRDGGGATRGGFMLEYGIGKLSDDSREAMFTHEMVHHFVGQLDGDSNANAWFGEGLAEFYKIRLPFRAKLLGLDAAAHEFGVMTEAYYTSPFVATPYSEIGRLRWTSRSTQGVPYNRGFMYFVNLNAKIIAHSHGKRSLDDLVLAMLERRRSGQSYNEDAWRKLLRAELGDAGSADLDAMKAGKLIVPSNDAFGKCFRRVRMWGAHRPVLGFEENSLLAEPYLVSDLDPHSAAAAAGLRNGDKIISQTGVTERIAHSASNVRLAPTVSLTVQRRHKTLHITFSTVGPAIKQYKWVPVELMASECEVP